MERPPEPTEEQYGAYLAVRRFLSWKANARKTELGKTDPRFREAGKRNLAKAREALARKRREARP